MCVCVCVDTSSHLRGLQCGFNTSVRLTASAGHELCTNTDAVCVCLSVCVCVGIDDRHAVSAQVPAAAAHRGGDRGWCGGHEQRS